MDSIVLVLIGLLMFVPLQIWAQEQNEPQSVRLTTEITRDDTFSLPNTIFYNLNLPLRIEFPDNPSLNYEIQEVNTPISISVGDGGTGITGEFQVIQENSTSRSTKFLTLSSSIPYESETYDKARQATIYHFNPQIAWFTVGDYEWYNTDIKSANLTTFDDGSGILSIYAEK